MNVAIPSGAGRLLVAHNIVINNGETNEEALLALGNNTVGMPLTPMYGWGKDGTINYVADPIGHELPSQSLCKLVRSFYQDRHLPDEPHPTTRTAWLGLGTTDIITVESLIPSPFVPEATEQPIVIDSLPVLTVVRTAAK